jgi:hypothetical protein
MDSNTVLVLGAGFTRAIVPAAPLIVGDYGVPALCKEFANFPTARLILEKAQIPSTPGDVDLERLMTRLTGMPYDSVDGRHECALATSRLLSALVGKLKGAKAAGFDLSLVKQFAQIVYDNQLSIVTFNYDDIVDEGLFQTPGITAPKFWHPDGGYGFFCKPGHTTVVTTPIFMNECRNLLLKLHGSVNWRFTLGNQLPRVPETVLHQETWFTEHAMAPVLSPAIERSVEDYLEPDPLIVPPVLNKSDLSLHPVLRLVWARARDKLAAATKVIFLGYSFPPTDLAARMLFQETLTHRSGVALQVVNVDGPGANNLQMRYQELFSPLDPQFDFGGAADWIRRSTKVT